MLEKEENKIRETKNEQSKEMNKDNFGEKLEIDKIDKFFYCIKYYSLLVERDDKYGNSIPLGAFCFAIAFILIGFKDCKVNKNDDEFFNFLILLFGCVGQLIAGTFEYINGRTLPANLYLLYGIYFLSYYYFNYGAKDDNILKDIKPLYYGSWAILSFPIFIGSMQSNLFYLGQTSVALVLFVLRCIGQYKEKQKINENVFGILELITGIISLYIGVNQIINESFNSDVIPNLSLSKGNKIDIVKPNDGENDE